MLITTISQSNPTDQLSLRRKLHDFHSQLRNQGFSPVEALSRLADDLVSGAWDQGSMSNAASPTSDLLAVAFQQFISDDARAVFGQYLTPMLVARHVAELLGPMSKTSLVMDPFMGSGILLDAVADASGCRTFGVEINEAVARVGQASVQLSGHDLKLVIGDAFFEWLSGGLPKVDAVVMNPPFGAQATTVSGAQLAKTQTGLLVGNEAPPVELLAIELAMSVLKPRGRMVAILPQSVLTNGRWAGFRKQFFGQFVLEHVTYLPSSTFIPFRGVARACVIVLRNERAVLPYEVPVFVPRSIGYDDTGRPDGTADITPMPDTLRLASLRETADLEFDGSDDTEGGKRLGDIAEVFRGRNPSRDMFSETGVFLLKVGSLAGGFISWRDRKRSRVPHAWASKNDKLRLREGDVCFTGTAHRPSYIGLKVDLISQVPKEGAVPSGEVVVVRLKAGAPISPIELLYYLRSSHGYAQLQTKVRGSSAHIYPKDLVEMRIPDIGSVFDSDRVAALHTQAEAAFRQYLALEDEIAKEVEQPRLEDLDA